MRVWVWVGEHCVAYYRMAGAVTKTMIFVGLTGYMMEWAALFPRLSETADKRRLNKRGISLPLSIYFSLALSGKLLLPIFALPGL